MTTAQKPDNLVALEKYLVNIDTYRKLDNRKRELRKEVDRIDKEMSALATDTPPLYSRAQAYYAKVLPKHGTAYADMFKVNEIGDLVHQFYLRELTAWRARCEEDGTLIDEDLFGIEV